jgi:hypothetical protein
MHAQVVTSNFRSALPRFHNVSVHLRQPLRQLSLLLAPKLALSAQRLLQLLAPMI